MYKVKCEKCKKKIDNNATICPYCRTEYSPEEIKSRNKTMTTGCLALLGLFVVIGVIGDMVKTPDGKQVAAGVGVPAVAPSASTIEQTPAVAEAVDPEPSGLTFAQMQAARSARQYLDISGFSRAGLIDQLSSDAGNGYAVADATAAVDSLGVDWNEQAVRSAKQYLELTGFSCKGLIEQLSSSAGNQYTVAQATYGARQAGVC